MLNCNETMLDFAKLLWYITIMLALTCCNGEPDAEDSINSDTPVTEQLVAPTPKLRTRDVAPDFTYAVWDTNGRICILAKLSASFQITYESTDGDETVKVNLPLQAQAKGRCHEKPMLELTWSGFQLVMIFTGSNISEKRSETWSLLSMELIYDTSSPIFDSATNVGEKVARSLKDGLFATSYGHSYFCPSPDVINLYNSKRDRVVLARMKDVHLQVHDVQNGEFSLSQRCSLVRIGGDPEPFAQDQTVPIAVGSTLAVVSCLVVIGYALWRNMATRKTDYDTME